MVNGAEMRRGIQKPPSGERGLRIMLGRFRRLPRPLGLVPSAHPSGRYKAYPPQPLG
jgi:hypothetical protein